MLILSFNVMNLWESLMAFSSYSFTINMWTDTDGESDYYGASIDKVERALISSMTVYDSRLVYEYKNRSS